MFNKGLFNRNAFNRNIASQGLEAAMVGKGDMVFKIVLLTPLEMPSMAGVGTLQLPLQMQQQISAHFAATGNISIAEILLRLRLTMALTGEGSLTPGLVVQTPTPSAIEGAGEFGLDDRVVMLQHMNGVIIGEGSLTPGLVMMTPVPFTTEGTSELQVGVILQLPLTINMAGTGDMKSFRVGTLSDETLQLLDINFMPGDTITIDTDLLQVLFGPYEDVSSVTQDSVFFELGPGENHLKFEVDIESAPDANMNVIAIWQNRWL